MTFRGLGLEMGGARLWELLHYNRVVLWSIQANRWPHAAFVSVVDFSEMDSGIHWRALGTQAAVVKVFFFCASQS